MKIENLESESGDGNPTDRPERPDRLSYTEIVAAIEAAPVTWLPGLFIAVAAECEVRKVFREGGLEVIMAKVKERLKTGEIEK